MAFAKQGRTRQTHAIYRPVRHEDPLEFEQIRSDLLLSWQPATPQERQLVELAASAWIRIQRAEAFETALLNSIMEATQAKFGVEPAISGNDDLGCAVAFGCPENDRAWKNIDRYRRAAHADYHRAITQLRTLQRDRKDTRAKDAPERGDWKKDAPARAPVPISAGRGRRTPVTPRESSAPSRRGREAGGSPARPAPPSARSA